MSIIRFLALYLGKTKNLDKIRVSLGKEKEKT